MIILNYKFKKLKINLRNRFHKKHQPDSNEIVIKKSLAKLLADDKTSITIFPTTNMIYIQTESKEYTIILSDGKIKITNHKLFIETYLNNSFGTELLDMVYRCLDKRKMKMDNVIFNNELDGLTYILNSLTNEKQ
jgi:hypothetical protein